MLDDWVHGIMPTYPARPLSGNNWKRSRPALNSVA